MTTAVLSILILTASNVIALLRVCSAHTYRDFPSKSAKVLRRALVYYDMILLLYLLLLLLCVILELLVVRTINEYVCVGPLHSSF